LIVTNTAHYQRSIREQSHFRIFLNAMARPGTVYELTDVETDCPAALDAASAAVALLLLDAEVTYSCSTLGEDVERFIARRTHAGSAPVAFADYIFADAASPSAVAVIENANPGSALDPETSAMLVASVPDVSCTPHDGATAVRLAGPGIETESVFYLGGHVEDFVRAIAAKNASFPLGLDVLMTCSRPGEPGRVVAVPRTARFL
jgi:phosphonate C-P lyase system protein PhnH